MIMFPGKTYNKKYKYECTVYLIWYDKGKVHMFKTTDSTDSMIEKRLSKSVSLPLF